MCVLLASDLWIPIAGGIKSQTGGCQRAGTENNLLLAFKQTMKEKQKKDRRKEGGKEGRRKTGKEERKEVEGREGGKEEKRQR